MHYFIMPYFKNEKINILFIHIPKTGGTSVETYFSKKYNIPLNEKSLFTNAGVKTKVKKNVVIENSLQHATYQEIITHAKFFKIDFNDIKIMTIVRNPYYRIISDLFFFGLINEKSSPEETHEVIKKYLFCEHVDGHNRPQYQYLHLCPLKTPPSGAVMNERGDADCTLKMCNGVKTYNCEKELSKIIILRTESLDQNMIHLGYVDFDVREQLNTIKVDYYSFLNNDSIELINTFYNKDFELFGYKKFIPLVYESESSSSDKSINGKLFTESLKSGCLS